MLDNLDAKEKQELYAKIRETDNVLWLANLATLLQMNYWYDPCGKSGYDIDRYLKDLSVACLQRIMEINDL